MTFSKAQLGNYGLGLGLRRGLRASTLSFYLDKPENDLIQWLELVPENYIDLGGKNRKDFLEVQKSGIPLIPHGVNLSIGTASEDGSPSFDPYLISWLKELFQEIRAPWFSDHISCTRIDDIYLQELIPMPLNQDAIKTIVTNIKFLQDEFQLAFLIENPSYYSTLTEPEMPEHEFINSIMSQADCGMLLDVNNIFVNSVNHNYDPIQFLENLDLERVTQLHIAGHRKDYTARSGESLKILDTHGENICPEVYTLLEELLKRTNVNAILLERDSNFPEFEELINELTKIRSIMNKYEKNLSLA